MEDNKVIIPYYIKKASFRRHKRKILKKIRRFTEESIRRVRKRIMISVPHIKYIIRDFYKEIIIKGIYILSIQI